MHSPNVWGGTYEVRRDKHGDEEEKEMGDWDKSSLLYQQQFHSHELDHVQQSWLLAPQDNRKNKKNNYVDLGCIVVKKKVLKWVFWSFLIAFIVIAMPIIIAKSLPKPKHGPPPADNYTIALHKALLFFNAQKSGKLPKKNGIPWRGNSGLKDGSKLTDVKGGENTKFHFPMAFSMTMLSWSVIEYPHKYEAIDEYDHVRELIKWGTDYLLKTFNSSATLIDKIYCQRPEDMDYNRPVQTCFAGADLAGEMAAALAAASIVFRDHQTYAKKLVKGAETVFQFARDSGKRAPYSRGNLYISPYYNSTGYYDEYMWGATWLYYATGNSSYGALATNPGISKNANAFRVNTNTSYLSWDNKLPAAMLLLTRFRMFLNPGFPYEQTLMQYHNIDYILGENPLHMSYVVGFGNKYPKKVHHRAASIPHKNGVKYSCKGGYKWRDSKRPNPNTINGAMVGGPDRLDKFKDNRKLERYTEPTLAGNAGLVAALVSLTTTAGSGVDRNLIFSGVPPLYTPSPPPPAPWKP
ncbi:Endoglucanase 12 [Bienertia sinuspersici]